MVEYAWALHEFSAEYQDEISFRAGERIEVIEKDDLYGDGWWKGRTPDGQVGIFPHAHTATNPPVRSANFGEHGDCRTPLPLKCAVYEEPPNSPPKQAEELEPEVAQAPPSPPHSPLRSPIALQVAPAEDVPASATESQFITATTSWASSLKSPITPSPPGAFADEPKLYSGPDPATIPKSLTVTEAPQSAIPPKVKPTPKPQVVEASAPVEFLQSKEEEPAAAAPSMGSLATVMQASPSPKPVQPQLASPITFPPVYSPMPSIPTATIVTQQLQRVLTPVQPTLLSAHFPAPMNASPTGSYPFQPPQANSAPGSAAPSLMDSLEISSKSNPMDWTMDQVAEWLKSKKFDDGIVAKFIEHEIAGDVLLELDVIMLKELDITALGKRMRIANAINELKRSLVAENSPTGIPNSGSGFAMPSEPGAAKSSSVSASPPTAAANVDEEPQTVLLKGSLGSKPPLATLTPVDRSASGVVPVWSGGQSQTTLSSVPQSAATEPTRPDQGSEEKAPTKPEKT